MSSGINLLPKQKLDFEKAKVLRKLKLIGGAILAGYVLFLIGLLTFSFFISSSGQEVKKELSAAENEVKKFKKIESLQLTLKGRVEAASKIVKNRVNQKELLGRIQNFVPSGVSLTGIEMAGDEVSFTGETQNIDSLGNFLDRLEKPDTDWSSIRLKSLVRNINGLYNFTFEANPVFK